MLLKFKTLPANRLLERDKIPFLLTETFMAPQSYNSFSRMVEDIEKAGVYGGNIYLTPAANQEYRGSKIALNLSIKNLKFEV